jgi:hypothetical protein
MKILMQSLFLAMLVALSGPAAASTTLFTSEFSAANWDDSLSGVVPDPSGAYVYAAGVWEGSSANDWAVWRVERRLVSTGALDWSAQYAVFGDDYAPSALALDGGYLYVLGAWKNQERLEKRDAATGALVAAFGSSGFQLSTAGINIREDQLRVFGSKIYRTWHAGTYDYLYRRDATTGGPDGSFAGGSVLVDFAAGATSEQLNDMVDTGTHVYVCGGISTNVAYIARYDQAGNLDTSFAAAGLSQTAGVDEWSRIAYSDGWIYAFGIEAAPNYGSVVVKFDAVTGAVDPAFGTAGYLRVAAGGGGKRGYISAFFDAGTHFYAFGRTLSNLSGYRRSFRFDKLTGSLDPAFGTAGIQETAYSSTSQRNSYGAVSCFQIGTDYYEAFTNQNSFWQVERYSGVPAMPSPTVSPTQSPSASESPTASETALVTATPSPAASSTRTPSPTDTSSITLTPSPNPSGTQTATPSRTPSPSPSFSPSPAVSGPQLDLEVWNYNNDATYQRPGVRITNYGASPIAINRLKVKAWVKESQAVISDPWTSGITFNNAAGVFQNSTSVARTGVITAFGPSDCGGGREAATEISFQVNSPYAIPAGGGYAYTLGSALGQWRRNDFSPFDITDDYTRVVSPAIGNDSVRVDSIYYGLYLDDVLVCEWKNASTPDPSTGEEPCGVTGCGAAPTPTPSPTSTFTRTISPSPSSSATPSRTQSLTPTPGGGAQLDLEVWNYNNDATYQRPGVRITNYGTAPIAINRLKVKAWVKESQAVISDPWTSGITFNNASNVFQNSTSVARTGVVSAFGPSNCGGGREAATEISFQVDSPYTIPANGGYAYTLGSGLGQWRRNDYSPFDITDDYTRVVSAAIGDDSVRTDSIYYALYLDDVLVCEWKNASTMDPNTGEEPCGIQACGALPSPTSSPAFSATATASRTPSPASTATITSSFTPSPAPSNTGSPTQTGTSTRTASPIATVSSTQTVTPSQSPSFTRSPSPSPSATPAGVTLIYEDYEAGTVIGYPYDDGVSTISYGYTSTVGHGATTKSNAIVVNTAGGIWGAAHGVLSSFTSGLPYNATGAAKLGWWIKTDKDLTITMTVLENNSASLRENWIGAAINITASPLWQYFEQDLSTYTESMTNPYCSPNCATMGNGSLDLGAVDAIDITFGVNAGTVNANVFLDDIAFITGAAPSATPSRTPSPTASSSPTPGPSSLSVTVQAFAPPCLSIGSVFTVVMNVCNNGGTSLQSISPSALGFIGTGGAIKLSGPVPAGLNLIVGACQDLTWTYSTVGTGSIKYQGNASGFTSGGAAVSSTVAVSNQINAVFGCTPTITPSATPSPAFSPTHSPTETPSSTVSPVLSPTPTATGSPSSTSTATASPSPSRTPSPTATSSPTPGILSVTIQAFAPPCLNIGSLITVVMNVCNNGGASLQSISPSTLSTIGTGGAIQFSGPVPAGLNLISGACQDLTWTYSTVGTGSIRFQGDASGFTGGGAAVSSTVATSNQVDVVFACSPTVTETGTPTETPAFTETPSATPTASFTVTASPTGTFTITASLTGTPTISSSPTPSPVATATSSSTVSPAPTYSSTLTPGLAVTGTPAIAPVDPGKSIVYPAPVRGDSFSIGFAMEQAGVARIEIFNERADLAAVEELPLAAGQQSVLLDARPLAAGVYFYRCILKYGDGTTKRLPPGKFMVIK